VDAVLAMAAVQLAAAVTRRLYPSARTGFVDATVLAWATVGIAVVGAYMLGLDDPRNWRRPRAVLARGLVLAGLAGVGGMLAHEMAWVAFPGRVELLLRTGALAAAFVSWRVLAGRWLLRRRRRPAVVLGTRPAAIRVADLVNGAPLCGHVVVAFSGSRPPTRHDQAVDVPYVGHPRDLPRYCEEHGVETVIVCTNGETVAWAPVLARLRAMGIRIATADAFVMSVLDAMPHELTCSTFLLDAFDQLDRPGSEQAKRVLDVTLALMGLAVFAVLLPVLYVLVRLESPGPFFYTQPRVGFGGKTFRIYKIRTMTAAAGPSQRWAAAADPRVTRVGRWLRRTRLDELPQLWNVLKGEMSVVGPRPEQPALAAAIEAHLPAFRWRTLAKPGITGWAQVHYGYADSLEHTAVKLSYDLFYVRNYDLFLDLAIILRTFLVMVTGAGAR